MSRRVERMLWWIGVPVFTGLVSWLPFWGWNLLSGANIPGGWWRVPVMTPGLFDAYVYLHWIGAAAEGLSYGGHLKWFGVVIQLLWSLMEPWASIPELWIVSRWITTTLTLWIMAWVVARWSGLGLWPSRVVAIGFWMATILTLAQRPGVYAWYAPFGLLSLAGVLFVSRALLEGRGWRAVAWSGLSLALAWVYPWFFMVTGLWIATVWVAWVAQHRSWMAPGLFALGAVIAGVIAIPVADWFLDPAHAGLLGIYERNGIVFARVPFFANTVLAMLAWIMFLVVRARRVTESARTAIVFLVWGWIVIFFLWFHTPFTGLHTYSDHFISSVVMLAWISFSVLWAQARISPPAEPSVAERVRLFRVVPWAVALGATAFVIYIAQQPIRFNLLKLDSYVIHLSHWMILALAGWLIVWRSASHRPARDPIMFAVILIPSILIGVGGSLPVFFRDVPRVPGALAQAPAVTWMREHIPVQAAVCADPSTALFYAAHTGRAVFPSEAVLSRPASSEHTIQQLETLASGYDVVGAHQVEEFQFLTDHYRTIPCANESGFSHNAPYAHALAWAGIADDDVQRLIGCRKKTIETNRARISAAITRPSDDAAFRALCPWVVIPEGQRSFWRLPSDASEAVSVGGVSVWKLE